MWYTISVVHIPYMSCFSHEFSTGPQPPLVCTGHRLWRQSRAANYSDPGGPGPAPGGPRRAVAGASFCGLSQLPRGSQARPPPVGPWRSWGGVGSFPDPRRPGTGSLSSRLSL